MRNGPSEEYSILMEEGLTRGRGYWRKELLEEVLLEEGVTGGRSYWRKELLKEGVIGGRSY